MLGPGQRGAACGGRGVLGPGGAGAAPSRPRLLPAGAGQPVPLPARVGQWQPQRLRQRRAAPGARTGRGGPRLLPAGAEDPWKSLGVCVCALEEEEGGPLEEVPWSGGFWRRGLSLKVFFFP